MDDTPFVGTNTTRLHTPILLITAIAGLCVVVLLALQRRRQSDQVVVPNPKTTQEVFSSLSHSNTYLRTSGWTVGANAHAEWFVPTASGVLSTLEIAAEPNYVTKGREKTAGNLTLRLARDDNGFPGEVVDSFSIAAEAPGLPAPTLPLVFKSLAQPRLQAGVKHWLCAGSAEPGSWLWHFNDQNLVEVSAREREPGEWHSAGNGRNGAFRVSVAVDAEE